MCAKASGVSCVRDYTYLWIDKCLCVSVCHRACVSGEPCVSVSPSVSEMQWSAGEERAWGSQADA